MGSKKKRSLSMISIQTIPRLLVFHGPIWNVMDGSQIQVLNTICIVIINLTDKTLKKVIIPTCFKELDNRSKEGMNQTLIYAC